MKILARPIEVITITDSCGLMTPLRFKAKDKNDEDIIIKVDKVESSDVEKSTGNIMLVYRCHGLVNDRNREFDLKYELSTCKWMLWRM